MDGEELLSRCFQHEIDHLDGMLFIFRMSALKRDLTLRKIRKLQREGTLVEPVKLVFCGTPRFAVPTLEALLAAGHEIALVVTQPDRPVGRTQQLAAPPVKQTALAARPRRHAAGEDPQQPGVPRAA